MTSRQNVLLLKLKLIMEGAPELLFRNHFALQLVRWKVSSFNLLQSLPSQATRHGIIASFP